MIVRVLPGDLDPADYARLEDLLLQLRASEVSIFLRPPDHVQGGSSALTTEAADTTAAQILRDLWKELGLQVGPCSGLKPQPSNPKHDVVLIEYAGQNAERAWKGHSAEAVAICNRLIDADCTCQPMFYSEADGSELATFLSAYHPGGQSLKTHRVDAVIIHVGAEALTHSTPDGDTSAENLPKLGTQIVELMPAHLRAPLEHPPTFGGLFPKRRFERVVRLV